MPRKPPAVTTPAKIAAVDRQTEAVRLRVAGLSLAEIAEALEYADPSGAHRAIAAALARTLAVPTDELRALELERLDALWAGVWGLARHGDVKAVAAALKVMQRRAKLLGLDARPEPKPDTPSARDVVAEMEAAADRLRPDDADPDPGPEA